MIPLLLSLLQISHRYPCRTCFAHADEEEEKGGGMGGQVGSETGVMNSVLPTKPLGTVLHEGTVI